MITAEESVGVTAGTVVGGTAGAGLAGTNGGGVLGVDDTTGMTRATCLERPPTALPRWRQYFGMTILSQAQSAMMTHPSTRKLRVIAIPKPIPLESATAFAGVGGGFGK